MYLNLPRANGGYLYMHCPSCVITYTYMSLIFSSCTLIFSPYALIINTILVAFDPLLQMYLQGQVDQIVIYQHHGIMAYMISGSVIIKCLWRCRQRWILEKHIATLTTWWRTHHLWILLWDLDPWWSTNLLFL
jgi:hypothetical protein